MLSVQPGPRGSSDQRFGRKMATFQLFFLSGRAKDLPAPPVFLSQQYGLYKPTTGIFIVSLPALTDLSPFMNSHRTGIAFSSAL